MPKQELKLYYWDDLKFGERYSAGGLFPGAAFALASSKEHAIELIVDDARDESCGRPGADEKLEALRAELMMKRAHIHYKPVGFVRSA